MTTTTNDQTVVVDHQIGATGRLAIRLASAELRLAATDGDRVIVRTAGSRPLPDRVIIEPVDGGLTIREKDIHGITFRLGQRVVQLEISVPARAEVSVDTASGWLDALGLVGEQRYRTASADTRLKGAAGLIDLITVSGDANLELAGAADLGLKSVSGDIGVRGGRLDALRVSTTSGDVRVDSPIVGRTGHAIETLSGDVDVVAGDGITVEARTVSGDLTTDLPHKSEGRMGRRSLIVGNGAIQLSFRSVSGDLRIRAATDAVGAREVRPSAAAGPAEPPAPPAPLQVPEPPTPPAAFGVSDVEPDSTRDHLDDARMAILRSLENGELDVATAMDRLAALDGAGAPGEGDRSDG
jgi:hypothetical protein